VNRLSRVLLLIAVQLLLVLTIAGKFVYERAHCPRVWVRTEGFDPNLPVRGRYLSLSLTPDAAGVFPDRPLVPAEPTLYDAHPGKYQPVYASERVHLVVRDGKLVAIKDPHGDLDLRWTRDRDGKSTYALKDGVPFYIPDHADLPSLPHDAETWAEVTVPPKGPPRIIRLGVKSTDSDAIIPRSID